MPDIMKPNLTGIVTEFTPKIEGKFDISSELDIEKLKVGAQFYARFVHDPNGDTMFWAKEHIADLQSGRVSRQNIPTSFWLSDAWKERPPLAEYLGKARFKIIE